MRQETNLESNSRGGRSRGSRESTEGWFYNNRKFSLQLDSRNPYCQAKVGSM
jgi:hypothetical protein